MPLDHNTAGVATGYGLDGRDVGARVPVEDFCALHVVQTDSGAFQPSIQWVPWVKLMGREVDHSPPPSAEVKNTWIYKSTHPSWRSV
jgi:hypothetical protein